MQSWKKLEKRKTFLHVWLPAGTSTGAGEKCPGTKVLRAQAAGPCEAQAGGGIPLRRASMVKARGRAQGDRVHTCVLCKRRPH